MKLAIICSNLFNIDKNNKTGTGIFNYDFINNLVKLNKNKKLKITVFTSGASNLPAKVESINFLPSASDKKIIEKGKHIMFELALISKALLNKDQFDIYHVNIGDGDIVMPFVPFTDKPILITLHHIYDEEFTRKYFSLFKNQKNVFFIPISDYQRKILPGLNYIDTIYHGIDYQKFKFNINGGEDMIWAGRVIPEKGPDIVIQVAKKTKRNANLFGIIKDSACFAQNIKNLTKTVKDSRVNFYENYERNKLIKFFQSSKLLLLPLMAEEAFGLVFIESMACGTPVVAFARGSAPEIIKDGENGFLVNPSDKDIRGNWIVKKTGLAGLCEAAEKIYSMPPNDYKKMRLNCREHVIKNFSIKKMINKYLDVYQKISRI